MLRSPKKHSRRLCVDPITPINPGPRQELPAQDKVYNQVMKLLLLLAFIVTLAFGFPTKLPSGTYDKKLVG